MNEPRTLTEAIERIAAKLRPLDWTDAVYNRVAIHDVKLAGQDRPHLKPMFYDSQGGYIDARPDDKRKSVLFFATTAPERNDYNQAAPTGHAPNHIIRTFRPLTLYGWINLKKLTDYDDGSGFPELIKLNLKATLRTAHCVTAIGDYRDGQLADVFKPFVISDLDTKFDRWPYGCFAQNIVVSCVETRQ